MGGGKMYLKVVLIILMSVIVSDSVTAKPKNLYTNYTTIKTFSPYIAYHDFSPLKGLANHTSVGTLEYGLRSGFFFDKDQQMEARLGYIQTQVVPGNVSQHLFTMGLNMMWYTFDGIPFGRPYLLAEAGTMWNLNSNEVHVGVDLGIGIILELFDWVPLRLEIRESIFLTEGTDTTISIGPHFVFDDHSIDSDGDHIPDYKDKEMDTPSGAKVDAHGRAKMVSPKVKFASGKSTIQNKYKGQIKEVGVYLQNNPKTIIDIEGHTDSQGPKEYNRRLSERRAKSVKRAFVKQYKISEDRISTNGFGDDNPVSNNSTASGRAMNRRIVIKFQR